MMTTPSRRKITSPIILLLCTLISSSSGISLSTSASTSTSNYASFSLSKPTELCAVSKRQVVLFDGSELASIVSFLANVDASRTPDVAPKARNKTNRVGAMTIVTGLITDEAFGGKSRRIVGVEKPFSTDDNDDDAFDIGGGIKVYADSVATVPKGISDVDAISTAASAICGVHCAAPRKVMRKLDHMNGGDESSVSGKAVVVGGGDYACFAARGLEAIGAEVSLVTTRPGIMLKNSQVNVMEPAVGKMKLGFASVIGKFDSLVDTLRDEAKVGDVRSFLEHDLDTFKQQGQWVISELSHQHGCERYVSAVTRSQRYVQDIGLLFARDPVLKYQKEVEQKSKFRDIHPPKGYGLTLQKLLDRGVIYKAAKNENGPNVNKESFVRGWALSDFMEAETWPRDSSGGASVRFGFPVMHDIDLGRTNKQHSVIQEHTEVDDQHAITAVETPKKKVQMQNPYVTNIDNIKTLNDEIVSTNENTILFVSASYCRTCKSMDLAYTRMARIGKDDNSSVMFAKADISGKVGKQIGMALDVDKVPAFILFQGGERYGEPISVNRLPSKKLDLAIDYLRSGKKWDPLAFSDDETAQKKEKKEEEIYRTQAA